ncbi:MAG: ribokinase [Anaerolineae bacterium]
MTSPFSSLRVLVLGAHTGAMQFFLRRFPAPGDYLMAERYREAADGAKGSNQAIAAARLGARVTLLSAVGDDERGRTALAYMGEQGIDVAPVLVSDTLPTGFGAGFYREDGTVMGATYAGATAELTADYLEHRQAVFAAGHDVFLASLELPVAVALRGLELVTEAGVPLRILNPSPADDLPRAALANVDVLTPNEPEARLLAGLDPSGSEPIAAVVAALAGTYAVPLVIATLGSEGCYARGRGLDRHFPCPRVTAVDTSGAGDCFNVSLGLGLAAGWDCEEAIEFALTAATLSVTKPDSWPAYPTWDEVTGYREQVTGTGV